MQRTKLTLSIDPELVKRMKIHAINSGMSVSRLTELLWKKLLESEK